MSEKIILLLKNLILFSACYKTEKKHLVMYANLNDNQHTSFKLKIIQTRNVHSAQFQNPFWSL